MINHFYEIIFSQKADTVDTWMDTCEGFDIPEINTFLQGTKKDLKAVKNGISYRYNNGLAEGSVNKIKVTKQIMYGKDYYYLISSSLHIQCNLLSKSFSCLIRGHGSPSYNSFSLKGEF